jgi:hypothetical protein
MSNSSAPTPAPVKKAGARWVTPALAIVAALVVGTLGGILIGQSTASASQAGSRSGGPAGFSATGRPGGGFGGGGFGGGGGGFTSGTIVSINGNNIVVKNQQGTDVNVTATSTTTVTKTAPSGLSDLKAGDTVTAIGQPDSSGNVTARSIAEGQLRGGGGAGAKGTAPTANG